MRARASLSLFVSLLAPALASAATLTTTVPATSGRSCAAYLRVPDGDAKLPLVLPMNGSGVYSNADDRAVSYWGYFLGEKKAAVLMFDKPGISLADGKVHVDDAAYDRYVADDLVVCAKNALAWATAQDGARFNGHVVVAGHSEGAMVAVRLLDALSHDKDPLLAKVSLVELSGVPLEPWKKILDAQLSGPQKAAFKTAFAKKDDKALRGITSIAFAYHDAASKAEALSATLERLAGAGIKTNLQVFQGLADQNVSAEAIRKFERWNNAQLEAGKPALQLGARYYEAGHGLSMAAVNDMLMTAEMLGF